MKSSMPCSSPLGHTVKTYRNGQHLLDDPELDDVVCLIVDQKMPEMTGLALLRDSITPDAPSIPSDHRIAGRATAGEARELGAIDVLVKPIDWEKLLKLVAYAVQ